MHYDPLRELDSYDNSTPEELVNSYSKRNSPETNPTVSDIQLEIATAIERFGSQVMDDQAKWNGMCSLIQAMYLLDEKNRTTTHINFETVEEEVEMQGETITIDTPKITVNIES